jgi:hypothetical protein
MAVQTERVRTAVGKVAWNVMCLFLVRKSYEQYRDPPGSDNIVTSFATWNKIYRAYPYNRWIDVVAWNPKNQNDNSGDPPHKRANLDAIFSKQPGTADLIAPPP